MNCFGSLIDKNTAVYSAKLPGALRFGLLNSLIFPFIFYLVIYGQEHKTKTPRHGFQWKRYMDVAIGEPMDGKPFCRKGPQI